MKRHLRQIKHLSVLFCFVSFSWIFLSAANNETFTVQAGSEKSYGCGVLSQLYVENSWNVLTQSLSDSYFNCVHFLNKDTGFVAGSVNTLMRTLDGGASWQTITTNTTSILNAITFPTSQKGFATSIAGCLLTTNDRGMNWQHITSGNQATIKRLLFCNSEIGYATNKAGSVLKTTDRGDNWTIIYSPTDWVPNFLSFPSSDTGYVAANNGFIAKTTDGGNSWVSLSNNLPKSQNQISGLHFLNGKVGFWSGSSGLFKTTDGGATWTQLISVTGIQKLKFFDKMNGYIVGKSGVFKKTIDGGSTWIEQTMGSTVALYDICFADSINGFVVGSKGKGTIFKKTYQKIDSCFWEPAAGLINPRLQYPMADASFSRSYTVTAWHNGVSAIDSTTIDTLSMTLILADVNYVLAGDSVTLSGVFPKYSGSVPLRYRWTPAEGLNCDTIMTPKASPRQTTTYTLTITTPGGCILSDNTQVLMTALEASTDNSIVAHCGDTVQLNCYTNSHNPGQLKYKWTPSIGLSSDTIASPKVIASNTTYTVSVKTPDGSQECSTSEWVTLANPTAPEICLVTVNEQNKNTIVWNRSNSNHYESYKVYKETNVTDQYELIGTVSADSIGMFVDNTANPNVQSNLYKIEVKDLCGFVSEKSNPHKTMHLSINKGVGATWNLIWEAYQGFTVPTYNIYRGTTAEDMIQIASCSGSILQYSDLNAPEGTIYYQIEVISPNTFVSKVADASKISTVVLRSASALTDESFSSTRSNWAFYLVSGVSINQKDPEFQLYPNPAKDFVELKLPAIEKNSAQIQIRSLSGVLLKETTMKSDEATLSIHNLPEGLYLIEARTANKLLKGKLVVKH
jgi:photosystem II stability/assembly factor-like uncharacterized protein